MDYGNGKEESLPGVSNLKIYPNPARDLFYIKFNNSSSGEYTITLKDVVGKTLLSKKLYLMSGKQKIPIDLSSHTSYSGLYLLNITSGEGALNFKVFRE